MNQAPLSRDDAIAIVQDWLRRDQEPAEGRTLGVVTSGIEENDSAFIVPWQAQAYIDGDPRAVIIGTFPVIVDKRTGQLVFGRPVIAFEIQLAEYAADRERDR